MSDVHGVRYGTSRADIEEDEELSLRPEGALDHLHLAMRDIKPALRDLLIQTPRRLMNGSRTEAGREFKHRTFES